MPTKTPKNERFFYSIATTVLDQELHVNVPSSTRTITLVNANGKIVRSISAIDQSQVEIDTNGLIPGLYYVHLEGDKSLESRRVVLSE